MKKIIIAMFLILVLAISSTAVYANTITPYYLAVANAITNFSIDNNGNSEIDIDVNMKSTSTVDRITGTVKIVRDDTGLSIKTWNNVNFSSFSSTSFYYSTGYDIPARGTYHVEATLKLYDGSTLKETIYLDSYSASF